VVRRQVRGHPVELNLPHRHHTDPWLTAHVRRRPVAAGAVCAPTADAAGCF